MAGCIILFMSGKKYEYLQLYSKREDERILYSIILVEDDEMQRFILKKMILSISDALEIYEADSESAALDIIKKNKIDMFLIDINLKKSSGLSLALKIRKIPRYEFNQIIFLTTHLEYITQAFKQTHCYDYILKPYDKNDLRKTIDKLILNDKGRVKPKVKDKEVVITLKTGIYINIKVKDIIFIEVQGKVCYIHTINNTYTTNNMSLKKIMKSIDSADILQSHRAFAINKNYILKIEKIDIKLSVIHFSKCKETALLGYKFKNSILSEFKEGKVIL